MRKVSDLFVTEEQKDNVFNHAFQLLEGQEYSFWHRLFSEYKRLVAGGQTWIEEQFKPKELIIVPRVVADAINHSDTKEELSLWIADLEKWIARYDSFSEESKRLAKEGYLTVDYFTCKSAGNPEFDPNELENDEGRIEIGDDIGQHSEKDVFTYFSTMHYDEVFINRHVAVFLLAYAKSALKEKSKETEPDQARASIPASFPDSFTPFIKEGLLTPKEINGEWFLVSMGGYSGQSLINEMERSRNDTPKPAEIERYVRYIKNGKLAYMTNDMIRQYLSKARKKK